MAQNRKLLGLINLLLEKLIMLFFRSRMNAFWIHSKVTFKLRGSRFQRSLGLLILKSE